MADEIFVGSVSVSVVPDLRGFNTKLRAELVPAASNIGKEIGREISKGIADNLGVSKVALDGLKKKIGEGLKGVKVNVEVDVTKVNLDLVRTKIQDGLKGIKVNIDLGVTDISIANTRRKINDGLKNINVRVGTTGGGVAGLIPGGRGGGAAAAAGGGAIGGIGALIRALPGGTSGSIAAVPSTVGIPAAIAGVASLPFIAQMLAGFVPLLGGGALAGLGVAGAFGTGGTTQVQVAQARAAAQAANARLRAAQARLAGLGGGGATPLATAAAQDRLAAAQARLSTARGGTSAAAILSAEAAVASAQDRINKLRASGGVSTAKLASAEAALASARASQSKASQAYQKAQADQITKGQEAVRQSFKNLANDAQTSLSQIGAPMVPVMRNLLETVDSTMKKLTPIFTGAINTIAGPFGVFSHDLVNAFASPQVKSSIQAVAQAFADVMKVFTPDIPGIVNSFADAIERIAKSVSKNPKAFADFLNFMFQVGILALNIIAFLSNVANWIEQHWGPLWNGFKRTVILALGPVAGFIVNNIIPIIRAIITAVIWVKDNWGRLWTNMRNAAKATWDGIRKIFASFIVDGILGPLGTILHAAAVAFGWIPGIGPKLKTADRQFKEFTASVNKSLSGINDQTVKVSVAMTAKTNPYPGGITGRAANGLYISRGAWGVDDQLILAQRGELVVPPPIVRSGAVDHLRGYIPGFAAGGVTGGVNISTGFPPRTDMNKMFMWNVTHLANQFAQASIKAMVDIGGKRVANIGSGVQRWSGTVLQALAMLGMSSGLLPRILYQMQTESGGNPNAINNWDINAQRGDPSRGLMQTIGSTFRAYHVLGTSGNIYDPLANIAAAINYARHTYGPTLGALGSGHGYAGGTGGAAAGWAWVGENGPELVRFTGGEIVVPASGLGGYANGTVAAAQSLAARNRAAAAATAARNRASRAAATARRRAAAEAIASFNRMVRAGTTLAAALAKITPKTTASVFASDQARFLADLRLYFSPSVAKARSQLVIRQIAELQSLQTHMKTLSTNIANATAFQQQELAHLRQGTGLGAVGIQGVGSAQGRSLLTGLNVQIRAITNFGNTMRNLSRAGASQSLLKTVAGLDPASGSIYGNKMVTVLKRLKSLHVPTAMINQLVALGPDAALAYTDALAHATPATLRQIIAAESRLSTTQLGVSRGVASVVSGGAYVTGANFVAGLKSQEKALEKQFAHLGKTLGQEAIRWMRVPSNKRPYGYQHGGWIHEPISGIGQYTGASYTFAEAGPEYVVEHGAAMAGARGGDGASYHAHFDGLTRAAIESHVQNAFQAMSIQQGQLSRPGRRS